MNLKDRMKRAGPIWKRIVKRTDTLIRQVAADGTSAGVITVTGIRAGDKLISVVQMTAAGAALVDLTSEFGGDPAAAQRGNGAVLTVDDQIDNTGGTNTSSTFLIITWEAYEER